MNTAFGKFVSGKFFDKLFLLFLLAGTVFMACAKGSAVRVLTDSPWLSGAVCVFLPGSRYPYHRSKKDQCQNGRQERRSFAGICHLFFHL